MDEPAASDTLIVAAKRLAALARSKRDDEGASQDHSQAQTALTKLDSELTGFMSVLVVHRALKTLGVAVESIPGLDKPAVTLRDRIASQGRPTAQYLNARVRDVAIQRSQMAENDRAAWRGWAEAQIASLPLALLPRLGLDQASTRERVRKLKSDAVAPPDKSVITLFKLSMDQVKDILAEVEDAGDLNALLARFHSNGGRLRLSEVADDEVALIRKDPSLAEQIFLSTT